jgi:hypothetical protein
MTALVHRLSMTRQLAIQSTVLLGVFVLLAATPAPVTFPDGPWEAALLAKGAVALLVANLVVTRFDAVRATRTRAARRVSTTTRLTQLRAYEHFHVARPDGVIGVVDEVLGDQDGEAQALVVTDGWFGRRRFLVPLADIRGIDAAERTIIVAADR